MKILKSLIVSVIIVLIFIAIYGFVMILKAEAMCDDKCKEIGAISHLLIGSGNFKIDDYCVCFFEDRIKGIKLYQDNCNIQEEC